jgi:hypothetical protein
MTNKGWNQRSVWPAVNFILNISLPFEARCFFTFLFLSHGGQCLFVSCFLNGEVLQPCDVINLNVKLDVPFTYLVIIDMPRRSQFVAS